MNREIYIKRNATPAARYLVSGAQDPTRITRYRTVFPDPLFCLFTKYKGNPEKIYVLSKSCTFNIYTLS